MRLKSAVPSLDIYLSWLEEGLITEAEYERMCKRDLLKKIQQEAKNER